MIDSVTSSTYEIEDPTGANDGSVYSYKIRAKSQCGESGYSNISSVTMMQAPGRVSGLSMSVNRCVLNLNWNEPNNNGSPLTEYVVDIRGLSGQFTRYGGC
jgi:hypothetical protein